MNESGDVMTGGLNMNNQKITNVGDPTADKDCSTKQYVDNLIQRLDLKFTSMNTSNSSSVKRY